jgi:hypothetical protein
MNLESYVFERKPNYEPLREFVYERISIEPFPLVLEWIVKEVKFHLHERGILLGKETFQDGTLVHPLKHNKEAKYSAFYKHAGYKIDYTIEAYLENPLPYLENPLHHVPMEIMGMGGGENLIPS